jgi:hypothetical protein
MKKKSIFLPILCCLSGCVSIPNTSTELVDTSSNTRTYCYDLSKEVVGKRIESLLSKCWGNIEFVIPVGKLFVPTKGDFQVINEQLENGSRYSIKNALGFGFSANVISGHEGCATQVQMFAVSSFWESTFTAIDQAVNEQTLECP